MIQVLCSWITRVFLIELLRKLKKKKLRSKKQLNLFRSNKRMSRGKVKLRLSTIRTLKQLRRRLWRCSKVLRMRLNKMPRSAFLNLLELLLRKRSPSKTLKVEVSSVNLQIPWNTFKKGIILEKSKLPKQIRISLFKLRLRMKLLQKLLFKL